MLPWGSVTDATGRRIGAQLLQEERKMQEIKASTLVGPRRACLLDKLQGKTKKPTF